MATTPPPPVASADVPRTGPCHQALPPAHPHAPTAPRPIVLGLSMRPWRMQRPCFAAVSQPRERQWAPGVCPHMLVSALEPSLDSDAPISQPPALSIVIPVTTANRPPMCAPAPPMRNQRHRRCGLSAPSPANGAPIPLSPTLSTVATPAPSPPPTTNPPHV